MKNYLKNFLFLFTGFFQKRFIRYYLLAIFGTVLIVQTDFDWYYLIFVSSHFQKYILFLTDILGFIIPFLFLIFVIAYTYLFKNHETRKFHLLKLHALVDSIFLGFLSSVIIKIFTGRQSPPHHGLVADWVNNSHNFNMGILQEQIFGGFPSSHTTVFFSLAFTIYFLYPKKYFLKYFSFLVAMAIGLGVTLGWHWFSEFFAGLILGFVVANIVKDNFDKK
jgi:membrane-associated phospholipid phosphatase